MQPQTIGCGVEPAAKLIFRFLPEFIVLDMLISLVHLSDVHLRESDNVVMSRIEPLVAAICEADLRCRNFVLILSGDVANQGISAEYDVALRMTSTIANKISDYRPDSVIHWLSVPGNHDCVLPKSEIQLRNLLVEGILPTLRSTPDEAILEQLLQKQANYFEFSQKLFGFPTTDSERLCGMYMLTIQNKKLAFALYNTALLSKRDEEQGLALPIETIRSAIDLATECDLWISVFHHPYVWLEPNDSVAFRDHIDRSSEIALTGHQHVSHGFAKHNLTGESVFYSEGHVLQESSDTAQSGFRVIVLDLEQGKRKVTTYNWTKSLYSPVIECDWTTFSRPTSRAACPTPSKEYLTYLSDSGIGLTHNVTGPLSLDTLFVYPGTILRQAGSFESQRQLSGDSLLQYISKATRVVITGTALRGKTALAKMLSREWLRSRQFYPLLISGRVLRSTSPASFDQLLDAECASAYGSGEVTKFRQLPVSAKALLVDDWDHTPLDTEAQSKLLKLASAYFGKIILFTGTVSYLDHLIHKVGGKDEIFSYDFLAIQELSFAARGEIIDKWLSLEISPLSSEFSRRVEEAERLIDTIIGKNTLPSLPFIVLAILQASQRNREVVPDNGSFGYLYEVLITSALNTTHGKHPQLDRKYQFLALLAFRLFDERTDVLSVDRVRHMLNDYAKDWIIKLDKDALISDLEYARILVKRDGHYTFAYPHFFHYFLARHFKTQLYGESTEKERARRLILDIAQGLNAGSNSIFLMFVIYLTNDQLLTDELVKISQCVLSEYAPSTFEEEVDFYNCKESPGLETRAHTDSIDLNESRRERREVADKMQPRKEQDLELSDLGLITDNPGYSDDLPLSTKLEYAANCIEILGQILRNFTGSLPGTQKLAILRATYLLGLRMAMAILTQVGEVTTSTKQSFEEFDPSTRDKDFERQIDRLLTVIAQIMGLGAIGIISGNVGSPDIEAEAYSTTLDTIGRNPATELVDLAIRLDHAGPEDYPFNLIKTLQKKFAQNLYAQRLLADLVVGNMHVFDIGRTMRQRVLATLGIKAPDEMMLSKKNKRLR